MAPSCRLGRLLAFSTWHCAREFNYVDRVDISCGSAATALPWARRLVLSAEVIWALIMMALPIRHAETLCHDSLVSAPLCLTEPNESALWSRPYAHSHPPHLSSLRKNMRRVCIPVLFLISFEVLKSCSVNALFHSLEDRSLPGASAVHSRTNRNSINLVKPIWQILAVDSTLCAYCMA